MKTLQESTISLKIQNNLKFVCELSSSQISISQITENQKTLVAKLSLKASYFKFYVKQQRFDVENLSAAQEIGPAFYYQDFAFTTIVNEMIYFYYYTSDNVLISMQKKIDDDHSVLVVGVDCILGEDVANYVILSTQTIYILHCRPNFISDGNFYR
jgi:hypothetical protein